MSCCRLYSYRARWYLPKAGVFAERDPLGSVDSVNLHQFLRYDPQDSSDALGLGTVRDLETGPFGKQNPAYQRAMEAYRKRPRVVVLPVLDFVEAWYVDPKTHEIFGSTVTTALVDEQGRLLPLNDQKRLLETYPILPRCDNPGLVSLIRSPQLIKLTYAQQGEIALSFLRLNLKIIKYGGLKVAIVATAVGALPVAGTALAVSGTAGALDRGIAIGLDVSRKDYKSVAVDVALLVIPMKANEALNGARILLDEERVVLRTVVSVTASAAGEAHNETR